MINLADLEGEKIKLEQEFEKYQDKFKLKIAVLSIPYELHRLFPTTGGNGQHEELSARKMQMLMRLKIF
jgi:hypothetical protein